MRRIVLVSLLAVYASGCSSRFDASSDEAARSSMKSMTVGLSPAEKAEFDQAVATVAMPEMYRNAFSGKRASPAETYRRLDGMTRSQILARAKEIQRP